MKLFNKKNEKKDDKLKKKGYNYRVTVSDPQGDTLRDQKTFLAKKTRNTDNNVVELENEQEVFREYFPLDYEQEHTLDEKYCDEQIRKLEEKQKKLSKDENPLNIKAEIFKWKKMKHSVKNQGGSYVKYDADGTPHFLYMRYRSVFVPMKWNPKAGHIHVPDEPHIKDVIKAKEEKSIKYKQNKLNIMQTILMVGFILMVIGFGIQGYFWMKLSSQANESATAKLQERIDETPLICAEYLGQTANNWKDASEQAEKNQNLITNVIKDMQKQDTKSNPDLNVSTNTENIN